MQGFEEGTGVRFSECHSFKQSFWFTFSVLAPDLGPMDTYEQGLTLKRKRGRKCHPCALENRSAVRRDEKGIVRTVQTVVTKQAFGPLFRT